MKQPHFTSMTLLTMTKQRMRETNIKAFYSYAYVKLMRLMLFEAF